MTAPLTVKGIVHGSIIELERAPNLPDGQEVTVIVQAAAVDAASPGEGLRRSAGTWCDDEPGLDEYLRWAREQRKLPRRGPVP